ncbi:hypothetical protein CPC08DRAFT_769626 [Agrocybe pediades]|nr:hypothetical protein CPC08DRAFT_769626 [Agrocybe pediades]
MSTSEQARLLFLPVTGAPSSTRGMKMTTTTNLSYPSRLPSFYVPWSAPAVLLVFSKTPIIHRNCTVETKPELSSTSPNNNDHVLAFIS